MGLATDVNNIRYNGTGRAYAGPVGGSSFDDLGEMETLIAADDALGAAYRAMDDSAFYTTALKNFITPWTNPTRIQPITIVRVVRQTSSKKAA